MDIKHLLRTEPEWLAHLESVGPIDVRLPHVHDLPDELLRLAVPHEDVNGVTASMPQPGTGEWWLLERAANALVSAMGDVDNDAPMLPSKLPAELGPYFYVHLFVAVAPFVRAYHRERGISDEVSRATLADLGRHMAVHRRKYGTPGVHAPWWHTLGFRGLLYDLGRLQFERAGLGGRFADSMREAGLPYEKGDRVLSVHIPDFRGPFTPQACDAAIERAREFFPRHFPDEPTDLAVCVSWLLDGQLADYLPAESNIIAFQRRFTESHHYDEDGGVIGFVYGQDLPAGELPRRTTLERAVADHLAAGRTWHATGGWFSLK